MPRSHRYLPVDLPAHLVQRGVNKQIVFRHDGDRKAFLNWLRVNAHRYQVSIHAWVLMTNHIHILATSKSEGGLSSMMAKTTGRYAAYFNHRYGRTGPLWQGRFKACLVASRAYLLLCYRYIELNPVRAGLVNNPEDFEWSSYRCNGMGVESKLCSPHEVYLGLGMSKLERLQCYRGYFGCAIEEVQLAKIRDMTKHGGLLVKKGNEKKVQNRLEEIYGVLQISGC